MGNCFGVPHEVRAEVLRSGGSFRFFKNLDADEDALENLVSVYVNATPKGGEVRSFEVFLKFVLKYGIFVKKKYIFIKGFPSNFYHLFLAAELRAVPLHIRSAR